MERKILFKRCYLLIFLIVIVSCISCKDKRTTGAKLASNNDQLEIDLIKKMEMDRLAAGVTKDLNVFISATSDDYMQIDFDGIVLDKTATLDRIKSSYAQLKSNVPEDMDVRIYGNTAVVTAKANPKGIMKGKEFTDAVRYTRLYVKRNDRWQVVLFQQTRIASDK